MIFSQQNSVKKGGMNSLKTPLRAALSAYPGYCLAMDK
jgi:hypothetical protein